MTDAELEAFLGIAGMKGADKIIASITPEKRALYERMANLETEVKLWLEGLGPKPAGVIICGCGTARKASAQEAGMKVLTVWEPWASLIIRPWPAPVPARGMQGFWNWPHDIPDVPEIDQPPAGGVISMGYPTPIEWSDATWNPVGGCSIKSPGCAPCYAQQLAGTRLKNHTLYAGTTTMVKGRPVFSGRLTSADLLHPVWTWPLRWRGAPRDKRKLGPDNPSLIFVADMSDLFHQDRSEAVIDRVVTAIILSKHIGQFLTKRPDVMLDYFECMERCFHGDLDGFQARWGHQAVDLTGSPCASGAVEDVDFPVPNIWLGFSAERQKEFDERWPHMRALAAMGFTIFCSYEPAIGRIVLPDDFLALGHRAQIIAGGMSGKEATPAHPDWFRAVLDQCLHAGVPFFFKQWGECAPISFDDLASEELECEELKGRICGFEDQPMHRVGKNAAGRLLDGVEHNGFPVAAP